MCLGEAAVAALKANAFRGRSRLPPVRFILKPREEVVSQTRHIRANIGKVIALLLQHVRQRHLEQPMPLLACLDLVFHGLVQRRRLAKAGHDADAGGGKAGKNKGGGRN